MRQKKRPHVRLFTKKHCSLCMVAKAEIEAAAEETEFELELVDITRDKETYREFIEQIPVIYINGRKAFKHVVDRRVFLEMIRKCTLES